MMKVSKRELVLLVVLFVLICGFFYYKFYFVGAMAEIEKLNAEVETLQSTQKDIKLKQAAVTMLKKQVEETKTEADSKLKKVIKSIDQPDMLVMLSNQLAGLTDKNSISFSKDFKELPSSRLTTVEVNFKTNYQELKQVLGRLNDAPYVNRVIVGTVESNPQNTERYKLEVKLTVEFFTLNNNPSGSSYPFMSGTYQNANLFTP